MYNNNQSFRKLFALMTHFHRFWWVHPQIVTKSDVANCKRNTIYWSPNSYFLSFSGWVDKFPNKFPECIYSLLPLWLLLLKAIYLHWTQRHCWKYSFVWSSSSAVQRTSFSFITVKPYFNTLIWGKGSLLFMNIH